jgi:hypothetical protein
VNRLIAAAALGVAASVLGGVPALAAPPASAEDTFESDACSFPVQVTTTGKVKVTEHGDQLITIAPGQKATLTNTTTGKSITLNLAGAFHEQVLPGGDLVGKGTGHNVFSSTNFDGLLYTTGSVFYRQDAEGVTITEPSAQVINLCDALA